MRTGDPCRQELDRNMATLGWMRWLGFASMGFVLVGILIHPIWGALAGLAMQLLVVGACVYYVEVVMARRKRKVCGDW